MTTSPTANLVLLHDLGVAFLDNHGERIDIEAKLSEARAAEVAESEERLRSLEGDTDVSLKDGDIFTQPKRVEITSEQIDAVFDAWMEGRVRLAREAKKNSPAPEDVAAATELLQKGLDSYAASVARLDRRLDAVQESIAAAGSDMARGRFKDGPMSATPGETQESPASEEPPPEKMIPISAINGLMNCIAGELGGGDGNVNVRLLPFYDLAARHTGHPTAMDLLRRRARLN